MNIFESLKNYGWKKINSENKVKNIDCDLKIPEFKIRSK